MKHIIATLINLIYSSAYEAGVEAGRMQILEENIIRANAHPVVDSENIIDIERYTTGAELERQVRNEIEELKEAA